jgi:hypothetical protein
MTDQEELEASPDNRRRTFNTKNGFHRRPVPAGFVGTKWQCDFFVSASLHRYSTHILMIFILIFIFKVTFKKTAKGETWKPSNKSDALSEIGGMQRGQELYCFFWPRLGCI